MCAAVRGENGAKGRIMRARASIAVGVVLGLAFGLGMYTFVYARGYSYLTNNPQACANCHVMQDYYAAWIKSSHRSVAKCNDCHTPHNLAGKYAIKATNGFFHSIAFTSGRFPDVIQIKGYNERVTEGACRTCHGEITTAIAGAHAAKDISCIRCHFNVGHSAASYVIDSGVSAPSGDAGTLYEESSHGNREQHR
jgi:cytochrome c nitrite reductase small subunit